jgi:hypothetical protein
LASLSRAYTRLNTAQHEAAKSSSSKKEKAETPKFIALSASQLAQQTQYARASARQAHVSYTKHQTRTLHRRRQRSINALRRIERAEMVLNYFVCRHIVVSFVHIIDSSRRPRFNDD